MFTAVQETVFVVHCWFVFNICIFWGLHVVSVTFRTHFTITVIVKLSPLPLKGQCLIMGKKLFKLKPILVTEKLTVFLSKMKTFCIYGYPL